MQEMFRHGRDLGSTIRQVSSLLINMRPLVFKYWSFSSNIYKKLKMNSEKIEKAF